MAWKPLGEPSVRKQRGKWAVRVDGVDTDVGARSDAPSAPTSGGFGSAPLPVERVP
jgi:hypothetical protein